MQDTFGYDFEELKEIIVHLNGIHTEAEGLPQQAIQDKFKAIKFMHVASVAPRKTEDLTELISKLEESDDLNSTADNIESVRQKTEMLFN